MRIVPLVASAAVVISSTVSAQVSFVRFAAPPGNSFNLTGMDAVGDVFIGNSFSQGRSHAYRWTRTTPYQDLGTLPGSSPSARAHGTSLNGTVVVGLSTPEVGQASRAIRWTAGSGMVDLDAAPAGTNSGAYAVTPDASVIVGEAGFDAFRWTQDDGAISIGRLTGAAYTRATAVSADGAVIAGVGGVAPTPSRAFRYTFQTGIVELAPLSGYATALLSDLSADGRIAVGMSGTIRATRWNEFGVAEGLPVPAGTSTSAANVASADGRIIGGYYLTNRTYPALWRDGQVIEVEPLLVSLGVNLSGWQFLGSITAISDDGATFGGVGVYTPPGGTATAVPWVATIPAPSTAALVAAGVLVGGRRRSRH
jgi:uncharacterized membrane protein